MTIFNLRNWRFECGRRIQPICLRFWIVDSTMQHFLTSCNDAWSVTVDTWPSIYLRRVNRKLHRDLEFSQAAGQTILHDHANIRTASAATCSYPPILAQALTLKIEWPLRSTLARRSGEPASTPGGSSQDTTMRLPTPFAILDVICICELSRSLCSVAGPKSGGIVHPATTHNRRIVGVKMTRHFFISTDLDDLERLEGDLEAAGVVTPQIHVLTLDDRGAENHHHLHQVTSLMKKDIIHSTIVGAVIGLCMSALVLLVVYAAGWTESAAGWLPFIFLAIIVLGFFTWEGGLLGIETPNVHFKRFAAALESGKHVFFVDLEPGQAKVLKDALKKHSTVEAAGTGHAAPHWIVFWQHRLKRFFVDTFP